MESAVLCHKNRTAKPASEGVSYQITQYTTTDLGSRTFYYSNISSGNNPIKYTDPDGNAVAHGGPYPGWSEDAPQAMLPYLDVMDPASALLTFNIHSTKLDFGGGHLRLWKGDYNNIPGFDMGGAGGEIGFYDYNGNMLKGSQLENSIGLLSSKMQLLSKRDNGIIAEYGEQSGWVTAFNPSQSGKKEDMYTVNTFTFKSEKQAARFANSLDAKSGMDYPYNGGENINIQIDPTNKKNVVVTWGVE
jgi:hypothetical protein